MIKKTLKLFVAGRIPSKKNSKQIVRFRGNVRLIASKSYLEWKKTASEYIKSQITETFGSSKVRVDIRINFPDNRSADLTNKAESLMDLLVDEKIIDDDKWQIAGVVNLSGKADKSEEPGAHITITEV